jgi:hypothetical protein
MRPGWAQCRGPDNPAEIQLQLQIRNLKVESVADLKDLPITG